MKTAQNLSEGISKTPVESSSSLKTLLKIAPLVAALTACGGGNSCPGQIDTVKPAISSIKNLANNQSIAVNHDGSFNIAMQGNAPLTLEVTFSEALQSGQQLLPAGINAYGYPIDAPTATPIAGLTVTYTLVSGTTTTYQITLTPDNQFALAHPAVAVGSAIPLPLTFVYKDQATPCANYNQILLNTAISNVPAIPANMPTRVDAASQPVASQVLPTLPTGASYQIIELQDANGTPILPISGVTATLVAGVDAQGVSNQTLRVDATGHNGKLQVILQVIYNRATSNPATLEINHLYALPTLPASLAPIATGDNGGGAPTTFAITAPVLLDANGVQIPYTVSGLPTTDAAGTPVIWTVIQTGNIVNVSVPSYRAGLVGAPPQQLSLTITSPQATGSTSQVVNITAM